MNRGNKKIINNLAGKIAIVTGGGSGIGRAACLALSEEGAAVVAVDLPESEKIQKTVADIRSIWPAHKALGLSLDVRLEKDMEEMVRQTIKEFGYPEILVHCAGILRGDRSGPKTVSQISAEEWHKVISTNLTGTFLSNRAVLSVMIKQRKGNIINISSVSALKGRAFDSAYCASKSGVVGLSESLAEEARQYGVKVQTILPDAVNTPLWDQNGFIKIPEDSLSPEHVAKLIIFILTLPEDSILGNITLSLFKSSRRKAR